MRTSLMGGIALFGTLAVVACGGTSSPTATTSSTGTPAPAATGNPTAAVTLVLLLIFVGRRVTLRSRRMIARMDV